MPRVPRKTKAAPQAAPNIQEGGSSKSASSKRSATSSARKPRVMRNRWEQHIYDTCGDGPEYQRLYLSDEQLDQFFRRLGIPESELAEQRRQYDATVNENFDNGGGGKKSLIQGRKPQPDEDPAKENVHIARIPDTDHLAIRFWDGGLEDEGQFCLDIYNMDAKLPVNSSELGFSIDVDPVAGTLSVLCDGSLKSWEARAGFSPERILPGEERFSVIEGAYLSLHRPSLDPFWFKAPVRHRLPAGVRPVSPVPL